MDELTAWLTLTRAPGLHAGAARALLEHFPSACELLCAGAPSLEQAGAGAALIDWLQAHRKDDLSRELSWLERDGCTFVHWGEKRYPPLLAQISDAPLGLYVRGAPDFLLRPQLAMVGSRNPSPTGRENAARFATHLTRCGLAITSGLAIGVDAASHRGALDAGGVTIAVCGSGVDVHYPRSNAALADEIACRGALVSEFPLGSAPRKGAFPRRNRIISGLSLGVL